MEIFGNKVFIVGIAGVSMSAIAKILTERGIEVAGADLNRSGEKIEKLKACGIKVLRQGVSQGIKKFNPDSVIYSVAIPISAPELVWAKNNDKIILTRGEAIGIISREYKNRIFVSGSHGKTTTTAVITNILKCSGHEFTSHIGGEALDISGNIKIGADKNIFLSEACEYFDSFLCFSPTVGVVLNVASDHLDYFKTVENLKRSFVRFVENVETGGSVIYSADDEGAKWVIENANLTNKKVYSFSKFNASADCYLKSWKKNKDGTFIISVNCCGKNFSNIHLPLVGEHNLQNALASILVAEILKISKKSLKQGLQSTKGVKRRYENLGVFNGAKVIHDYAHHPDEIGAVISETKSCMKTNEKLVVVFEPHTFTRTQNLWGEFVSALNKTDCCIMLPIFPAREKPIKNITSEKMADEINFSSGAGFYAENYLTCKMMLERILKPNCKCLLLGAGNIDKFGEYLFKE